ncbi:YncE family protein [Streptomyces sp. LP05-1]|uniref:YncE family protein n=1 Tax=Streptomyces pyxinae TaxID=2970734 RepID=A0ABT2CBA0_9ACTN|nr:YncE family protein [Streptomyces sp. LP05-1]MCS0634687.1 YncE family protein [Streptomyces sp. LP05-1]
MTDNARHPQDAPRPPAAGAASPRTGDMLAVVSQGGSTVTFFDALSHERLDVLPLPSQPHELFFDPARRLLYASITYHSGYYHANAGRARELVVIDPDTRRIVESVDLAPDHAPHDILLDPVRDLIWVSVEATEEETGGLVALDATTRERVRRVPVHAPGPHWFALTPDGRRAYSANKEAPFVSVVDMETGEALEPIEVPGSEGIAVSPDGRYVYVAAPKGDYHPGTVPGAGVRIISTATGRTVRTLSTDNVVFPVHTTSQGLLLAGELRVSAGSDGASLGTQQPGTLHIHDTEGEPLGRVPVGAFPLTITSSPDGRYGYVAAILDSTVTVVDLAEARVVTTLEVEHEGESGAHGLAYIPAP